MPDQVRPDAGHAAGPRARFPRNDRPERVYRVWAVRVDGPHTHLSVLHTSGSLKTALALAAAESVSPDLGADVTEVAVSSPDGREQIAYHVYLAGGV